jgi:hypothetical protein
MRGLLKTAGIRLTYCFLFGYGDYHSARGLRAIWSRKLLDSRRQRSGLAEMLAEQVQRLANDQADTGGSRSSLRRLCSDTGARRSLSRCHSSMKTAGDSHTGATNAQGTAGSCPGQQRAHGEETDPQYSTKQHHSADLDLQHSRPYFADTPGLPQCQRCWSRAPWLERWRVRRAAFMVALVVG